MVCATPDGEAAIMPSAKRQSVIPARCKSFPKISEVTTAAARRGYRSELEIRPRSTIFEIDTPKREAALQ